MLVSTVIVAINAKLVETSAARFAREARHTQPRIGDGPLPGSAK